MPGRSSPVLCTTVVCCDNVEDVNSGQIPEGLLFRIGFAMLSGVMGPIDRAGKISTRAAGVSSLFKLLLCPTDANIVI